MPTTDSEIASRRIPTLVQLCQRVAANHVDSISSLGDELRYELLKPILQRCSADALLRLEDSSPHIKEHTQELWEDLCFKTYPLAAEGYCSEDPESWRDHFFFLREIETKKLEELGNRIKTKRLKADDEKKEREIKSIDGLLPTRRQRKWGSSSQPKTLFQKTRSETSKIHKGMFSLQTIPRMPDGKTHRVLHHTLNAKLPPAPPSAAPSRVTTTHVPPPPSLSPSRSTSAVSSPPDSASTSPAKSADEPSAENPPNPPPLPRPTRATKKDPTSTLFIPKRHAHSQLPSPSPSKPPTRQVSRTSLRRL